MNDGLLNFDWNDVDKFSEEEITYFLSLEGKSMEAMCRIRALTKEEVQRHIIEGKIKYRYLAKSKTLNELFETICKLPKAEKLTLLQALKPDVKEKLLEYIKSEYMNMPSIYKETAIWILGELKDANGLPILQKAVVHKHTNIRRMAVSALGKIGDKASENALIRALEDENPQVVSYAVKALGKVKSERAYDKIKYIYNTTTKEYVKKASEEYMSILEKR